MKTLSLSFIFTPTTLSNS